MKSESEDSPSLPLVDHSEINELAPDFEFQYPDTPTSASSQQAQLSQPSGRCGGACQREFQMPRVLNASGMNPYSAQSLYDDIKRGSIDLNPEYQRDVVWNAEKQMGLIDSIWAQIYIPPVIFLVQYDGDGGATKTCLDGKQRLTSIQRFMDGVIPYKHPITNEKWWYKNPASTTEKSGKSTRLLLPEEARKTFANRQVYCVEYEELDEDDEREIFRRVQLGVALSTAEKLHVINTPRAHFIRELLSQYCSSTSSSTSSSSSTPGLTSFPWDRKRGADFRCFAQSVYCLFKWSSQTNSSSSSKAKTVNQSDFKNLGSLPQLEKWLGAVSDNSEMTRDNEDDAYGESLPESFVGKVKETFEVMVRLANENEFSGPFYSHKKVSPVEIIAVSLLIYVHHVLPTSPQAKFTLAELGTAFAMMRTDVRKHHADIRLNDKCGKTLVQFVKDVRKEAVREVVQQGTGTGTGAEVSVGRVPVRAESASVSVPAPVNVSVQGQGQGQQTRTVAPQTQHARTQMTPSQSQPQPQPQPPQPQIYAQLQSQSTPMPQSQQMQGPQFAPQSQSQPQSVPTTPQPQPYWPQSQPQPRPQSQPQLPQPQPHSQLQPQAQLQLQPFRTNTGFISNKLIIPPGPSSSTSTTAPTLAPAPVATHIPAPAPNTLKRPRNPSGSDTNPSQLTPAAKRRYMETLRRSPGGPTPRVPSQSRPNHTTSLLVPPQTLAAGRVSASTPTAASQASPSKQELLEQLEMNELLSQMIPLPLPPSTPGSASASLTSSSSAIIPPSSSFPRTALEQRKRIEEGSQSSMLTLSMSQPEASSRTSVSQSPLLPVGAVASGSQTRRPLSTAPALGSASSSLSSSSSSQPLWTSKPL